MSGSVALPPGHVQSRLEELFVPTEYPFVVDDFAKHAERVAYVRGAVDDELLRSSAMPLSLPQRTQPLTIEEMRKHPLLSVRTIAEDPDKAQNFLREQRLQQKQAQTRDRLVEQNGTSSTSAIGPILLRVAFFHHAKKIRVFEVHSHQKLHELCACFQQPCITSKEIAYQKRKLRDRQAEFPAPSDGVALSINGMWYWGGSQDPSTEARAWLESRKEDGAPRAPVARMKDVTFGELYLRLGAQYLFVHHGNCEHDIVFTRCSLTSPFDPQDASAYPRVVWERKTEKTTMCTVCNSHAAAWDIHGDRLADTLPCQLCDGCHFEAHYRADKRPQRTDYRVYPMLDNSGNSERRDVVDERSVIAASDAEDE